MRFISKIDLKSDKFVKSVQMEGLRVVGDPKEIIKNYYTEGLHELILHDISASWFGQKINFNFLKNILKNIYIPTIIGGGINSLEDCDKLFNCGADKVLINTGAINKHDLIDKISKQYGSQAITILIEYKINNSQFEIYKCFGREKTNLNLNEWVDEIISRGAGEILFCSIDRDGTEKGFDINILNFLKKKKISIPVIISGGYGQLKDLEKLKSFKKEIQGISISKSLHFNKTKIKNILNFLENKK